MTVLLRRFCLYRHAGPRAGQSRARRERLQLVGLYCGVHMLDSSDDILTTALHDLGLDLDSTDLKDLEKAADLVTKVRPSVRKFHSSEYLNAMAGDEICLVVGWSGEIKQTQRRAAEANNGIEIGDPERRRADVVRQSGDS